MKLAQVAIAAGLALAPALAHATTYRLDALVNGAAQDFGTISIDAQIVAEGSLDLTRSCPQFSPCIQTGPWDQVTFDFTGPLENGVLSTGPGAVNDFALTFDQVGDVSGGSIHVQAPEGQGVTFLSASLGGEPGPCDAGTLCGTYIPVPLADAVPISLTFVQEAAASPIPEPEMPALVWLLAFGALGMVARVRR